VVGDLYHTGFADEEAKELIRQAGQTIASADRQTLYEQAAAKIWNAPPFIYLHQINWNYAAKSSLKTFTWMPNRIFSFSDTELS
jgi:ABC-type transport system substrate-binding protein